MKFIRGKFKFFMLAYIPIFMAGAALIYYFPEKILGVFRILLPIFLILAIILGFSPAGKQPIGSGLDQQPYFWRRLTLWWCLELTIFLVSLTVFLASIAGEPTATQTATLQNAIKFYLYSGLFPWSLYLLLGLAFAYCGRQNNLGLVRSSLWPIYKKQLDNLPGLGSDICIKQGSLIIGALTLSLCLAFAIHLLHVLLTLQSPINHSMIAFLGSSLIFILLSSPFWRRLTRYLWLQHSPLSILLMIYAALAISCFIVGGVFLKIIITYVPPPPEYQIRSPWLLNQPVTKSLLLVLCWQILTAPWIATLFAKLAQGFTIRTVIFQALSLPLLISFIFALNHFWFNSVLSLPLIVGLLLALVSLSFTLLFFQLPENLHLVQLTHKIPSRYPNVKASRNFLILTTFFLFLYFLMSVSPLIIYISGALIPVFLILCGACLSLLISLK